MNRTQKLRRAINVCRLWLFLIVSAIPVMPVLGDHPGDALFQTYGYLRDNFSNPVVGISVVGDNYIGDFYPSVTDSNGFYLVSFPADGNYRVTVDCAQLAARGFGCLNAVGVAQEADPIEIDFVVTNITASLQITNTVLPRGNAEMPYEMQLSAIGGQPPYSWRVATNSTGLPTGLSLTTNGLISGTPTTFSAANIIFEVADANSVRATKTLLLIVNPKPLLTPVSWISNRFTLRLAGAAQQNYTLQVSTNLATTNWTSLFVTNNPEVGTFLVRDTNSTNKQSFYRILIGP